MLLRELIRYEVMASLLEIRGTFKWPEFKKLQTLEQKFQYAANNLQQIGKGEAAGGSRAAFVLSNRYVLKVARPERAEAGLAQNKAEVSVFDNTAAKPLVPTIYDMDPQYHWIVSEIANPVASAADFEKLSGISWSLFEDIIRNYKDPNKVLQAEIAEKQQAVDIWTRRGNKQKADQFQNIVKTLQSALQNKIVTGSLGLINQAGVMPGDIWELKHWAKTADGRLVIIDTGFTRESLPAIKAAGAAA